MKKEFYDLAWKQIEAFTEAVPLRDDLTVIVLKYLGE